MLDPAHQRNGPNEIQDTRSIAATSPDGSEVGSEHHSGRSENPGLQENPTVGHQSSCDLFPSPELHSKEDFSDTLVIKPLHDEITR